MDRKRQAPLNALPACSGDRKPSRVRVSSRYPESSRGEGGSRRACHGAGWALGLSVEVVLKSVVFHTFTPRVLSKMSSLGCLSILALLQHPVF